jgi:hypothetical protein
VLRRNLAVLALSGADPHQLPVDAGWGQQPTRAADLPPS